ncbi:ATP-binding protein [Isosphaeraceae bacterium EP7]
MLRSLRSRLLLGIAPLLAIIVGLGLWAVVMFSRLGGDIDVILRENYKSVLAAQNMRDTLERMDSALLFAIGGQEEVAASQFRGSRPGFEANLRSEQGNVTLPGEEELAEEIAARYAEYLALSEEFFAIPPVETARRTRLYFGRILPEFKRIKDRADDVLRLNQRNMEDMDRRARASASSAVRWMVLAVAGSAIVATLIAVQLSRSILEPIRGVTDAARSMARGNLEQVVPVLSRDELGELASAFNTMAHTIRDFRQAGTARILRAQKTAQATIDSFPDPVVVIDPSGSIERSNPAAQRILGISPAGEGSPWLAPRTLRDPLAAVLGGDADYLPSGVENAICMRDDGQERYYLPRILAMRDDDEPMGAALVLHDVTKFRLVDQLKSDMVATVSHELKTPLTGLQMAIHLLLEEAVGPLEPGQVEMLLSARQDTDRLLAMVNDLLDLTRIEQGSVRLDLRPVSPADLVSGAVGRFESQARDAGIELAGVCEPGLPPVPVDVERFEHVFDNLIVNALAHTSRGKSVRVSARAEGLSVRFEVADEGEGIPSEHLPRIFERFYRVPGGRSGGAGLGLAIAREIVIGHGGQIQVSSDPGHGATFTFLLPAARGEVAPQPLQLASSNSDAMTS